MHDFAQGQVQIKTKKLMDSITKRKFCSSQNIVSNLKEAV